VDARCVDWFKSRLEMLCPSSSSAIRNGASDASDFAESLFRSDVHTPLFARFLADPATPPLFAFVDASRTLQLTFSVPKAGACSAFVYLLRSAGDAEGTWDVRTIRRRVHVGVLKDKSPLENLQRLMSNIFAPAMLNNKQWPETIRKDFSSQVRWVFQ